MAFLTLSLLLAFRALDIWFSDAIVWLVLVAAGGALLWRQSTRHEKPPAPEPQLVSERAACRAPAWAWRW